LLGKLVVDDSDDAGSLLRHCEPAESAIVACVTLREHASSTFLRFISAFNVLCFDLKKAFATPCFNNSDTWDTALYESAWGGAFLFLHFPLQSHQKQRIEKKTKDRTAIVITVRNSHFKAFYINESSYRER